ncbi:MAG: energy transducer TonB [bacterium]
MKCLMIFLLTAILYSCAGTRQNHEQERKKQAATEATTNPKTPVPRLVVVTSQLDVKPEPVGGTAAIQAAVQEPEEVWKENKMGTTEVEARINANGKVTGTKVRKSSGYAGMDAEAMLAVARVLWKPARKKNMPVEAVVRVAIDFNGGISSK